MEKYPVIHPDGQIRWLHSTLPPFRLIPDTKSRKHLFLPSTSPLWLVGGAFFGSLLIHFQLMPVGMVGEAIPVRRLVLRSRRVIQYSPRYRLGSPDAPRGVLLCCPCKSRRLVCHAPRAQLPMTAVFPALCAAAWSVAFLFGVCEGLEPPDTPNDINPLTFFFSLVK